MSGYWLAVCRVYPTHTRAVVITTEEEEEMLVDSQTLPTNFWKLPGVSCEGYGDGSLREGDPLLSTTAAGATRRSH